MDSAMPEVCTCNKPDVPGMEALDAVKRQQGDGNDCCNPSIPVLSAVPAGKRVLDRENVDCSNIKCNDGQVPLGDAEARLTDQEINVSVRQTAANDSKPLTVNSSNVSRAASKEIRHQSRQLQSQELIRRILQSTAEVQSLVLHQKPLRLRRENDCSTSSDDTTSNQKSPGENQDRVSSHCCPTACIENEKNTRLRVASSAVAEVPEKAVEQGVAGLFPPTTATVGTNLQPSPQPNGKTSTVQVSEAQTAVISIPDCPAQGHQSDMDRKVSPRNPMLSGGVATSETGEDRRPVSNSFASVPALHSSIGKDLSESAKSLDQPLAQPQQSKNTLGGKTPTQTPPSVYQLGKKLESSPTQETLKEILSLLRQQSQLQSADNDAQSSAHLQDSGTSGYQSQSAVGADEPPALQPIFATDLHPRNQVNIQEQQSKELSDVKSYYEGELEKMRGQLDDLRGNLSSLEGVLPMKMLEATNHKLEQRCRLLEEIADELKSKCDKLEVANQALDITCCQLQTTNQAFEIRYHYLEQANQVLAAKQLKLQDTIQRLENKLVEVTETSKGAEVNCQQLEQDGRDSAAKVRQLEDARDKLESMNEKLVVEMQGLSAASEKMQETLLATSRHCLALEEKLAMFQAERDDWLARMGVNKQASIDLQHHLEEMRTQCVVKDEIIQKLKEEIEGKNLSFTKVNKGRPEFEENAKRDKELLQNLLIEYDSLVKEHQQSQMREKTLASRLQSSEGEINDLRGTVSKLIHRNSGLEDSLKDNLLRLSREDSLSPGSRVESPALERPQGFASASVQGSNQGDMSVPRRTTPNNNRQRGLSPAKPELSGGAALTNPKVDTLRFNPSSKSTSTPVKSPKRSLEKSYKAASPGTKAARSPSNLVVKKADLVTRFDVVFEDVSSGELVSRSHSGRTVRSYDSPDTAQSDADHRRDSPSSSPESTVQDTLDAIRGGKVMSAGDWEGRRDPTVKKAKNKSAQDKSTNASQIASDDSTLRRAVLELERKLSSLMDERKRLESTLSRIPAHRPTKRAKEDKAYLENRLDEVTQGIGSVRMQLRHYHAL